jgi:hypothetical protein
MNVANAKESIGRVIWLGAGTFMALAAGWFLRVLSVAPEGLSALGIGACLVIAFHVGFARSKHGGESTVTWIGAAASIAVVAWISLDDQIHQGFAEAEYVVLDRPSWAVLALPLGAMIAHQVAGLLARLGAARRLVLARTVACTAIALSWATASVALLKRASHEDPDSVRAHVRTLGCFDDQASRKHLQRDALSADVSWDAKTCTATLRDEGGNSEAIPIGGANEHDCLAHCIRRLPGRLWLVSPYPRAPAIGLSGSPLVERPMSFASFARELAPPVSWSLDALLGALAAIVVASRRDRVLDERLRWSEEMIGGAPFLVNPHALSETYRSSIDRTNPAMVMAGTHASVRDELARRGSRRWVFAAAVTLLFGAPLWVAAARGFLCW